MMRYLKQLADRDYALDRGMIPLGSCTMKLNAATEMAAVSWPEFSRVHPFAPEADVRGYLALIEQLEVWLAEVTGYDAVSLQPNAGSQGELAGLLAIRGYHRADGDVDRTVCLIPSSAHGTNAASAVLAGMKVVVVACDEAGNVDLDDLRAKIALHADALAALMITYPSTHGVYEHDVLEITQAVHDAGGQVYVDGANLNALLGYARFGDLGGDVSHLNLHKTFAIPHGGGGPGVGPVAAKAHLAPYLPGHPFSQRADHAGGVFEGGPVSAAPHGSAGILPISWAYVRMLGAEGLRAATAAAVLAANYIAVRLREHYPVLYTGEDGLVAHECILDLRPLREATGVTVDDVAKRLIDYGFHAPTMSFPVAGTLMVEPTESEDLAEIERFIEAMIAIKAEAVAVAAGEWPADDNPLVNAPHTARRSSRASGTTRTRARTRCTRCTRWCAPSTGRRCAGSTRPTATATWCAPARRSRRSPEAGRGARGCRGETRRSGRERCDAPFPVRDVCISVRAWPHQHAAARRPARCSRAGERGYAAQRAELARVCGARTRSSPAARSMRAQRHRGDRLRQSQRANAAPSCRRRRSSRRFSRA